MIEIISLNTTNKINPADINRNNNIEELALVMDVGRTLSGSQILQRPNSTEYTTTAETRSDTNNEQTTKVSQMTSTEKIQGESINKDKLASMVDGLNEFLEPMHTSVKFELHDKLEEYYVTIVDSQTKEVVKEIPPKKMLDMYAAMAEFMGLIVDKKA